MTFQKDGTVENYYKFFKEDAGDEDPTDEDREALSREMKDILGEEDELDRMLLAASAEGFSYLASTHNAGNRDSLSTREIPYQDDEDEELEVTEYMAYKFVGRELFVSDAAEENESEGGMTPKVVGDSRGKRTTSFDDVIIHE